LSAAKVRIYVAVSNKISYGFAAERSLSLFISSYTCISMVFKTITRWVKK